MFWKEIYMKESNIFNRKNDNMKTGKRIKLKPSSFIIYGLVLYFILYFINPFIYSIYSLEGVLYFALAYILLFLGAYIAEKITIKNFSRSSMDYVFKLSKCAEIFLILLSLISIISFIIYFSEIVKLPLAHYNFASEDLRLALSASRTNLSRISEMLMYIGPICYLISSRVERFKYKNTYIITLIAFFMPSLGILSVGARGAAVISLFIFFINMMLCKNKQDIGIKTKNIFKKLATATLLFGVIYFILNIFITRPGLSTAEDLYLFYPGDTELKSTYRTINQLFNNSLDPIYKAFMYYTHSFPSFTYFYMNAPTTGIFFGVVQFSFIFSILNAIGITTLNPNMVALYNPASGLYSTFVSYFILDYGNILALPMIFFSGVFFGIVFNSAKRGSFGYFIYPIILTMCLVSPIYYFWTVGRMDVMLFWYFIIYPIIKLLGLKRQEVN